MSLRPMSTAPKDGTEIVIKVKGRGLRRVRYVDCTWLRRTMTLPDGREVAGDPTVTDCWRAGWGDDIELEDALGWRPAL